MNKQQVECTTHETLNIELSYFLRFITFVHMSSKPTLASLSGKPDIALAALST